MKYIDADRLIAEIERLIRMNQTKNGFPAGTCCAIRIDTYEHLLSFVTSLQEEQIDKEDAMTEQGFRIIDDGIWISRSELEKMKRKYFGSALEAMDVKKEDTYRHAYFAGQNNLCLDLLIRIDGCKRPLTE